MFRYRTRHPVFYPDLLSDLIFMGVFLVIIRANQFHVFMGKYSLIGGITYIGGNSPDGVFGGNELSVRPCVRTSP